MNRHQSYHICVKTAFVDPNQKNIYGAALSLIAVMYGIMQGIIAVVSLLATMHNHGNGMDPQ